MNLKRDTRSSDEDDIDIESLIKTGSQCPVYKNSMVCNHYTIMIDDYVVEPSYYRNAVATLRGATENDRVDVLINSYGGNLDSALMLRNAMDACEAEVWCVLEGVAVSAGSLLALSANAGIIVKSHACMMIHHASFGVGGTTQNVVDQVGFYKKRLDKLTQEVYADFLSEDEIKDVINNKEIWLDEFEIGERIKRMYAARAARAEEGENKHLQDENVGVVFEESVQEALEKAKPTKKAGTPRKTKKGD